MNSCDRLKITIITPAFKCARYIKKCIESVLAQDYDLFEHIIVDGFSQDGTIEILSKYKHLVWISEPDGGEVFALNKALKMATGDIIGWLNADDWYEPNILSAVVGSFENGSTDIVYGNTHMVDLNGATLWEKNSMPYMNLNILIRWWFNTIHPHQPSMFFKKDIFEVIGGFDESLHFSIDYNFWLRCSISYSYQYLDRYLSCALQREEGKGFTDDEGRIGSHWQEVFKVFSNLAPGERLDFWGDFFCFHASTGYEPLYSPPLQQGTLVYSYYLLARLQKIQLEEAEALNLVYELLTIYPGLLSYYSCYDKSQFMDEFIVIDRRQRPNCFVNFASEYINSLYRYTEHEKNKAIKSITADGVEANSDKISVLYDVSVLGLAVRHERARTGIARAVEEVARALLDLKESIILSFVILVKDKTVQDDCLQFLRSDPMFCGVPCYLHNFPVSDIFHSPFYALPDELQVKARLITIYDLIPFLFPDFCMPSVCEQMSYTLSSIKLTDHVLAISHSTKRDLIKLTGLADDNVHVTHLAASRDLFYPVSSAEELAKIRSRYKLPDGPYLLSVCTLEPRKNLDQVIRCFARTVELNNINDLTLVLVGAVGWKEDKIRCEINNSKNILNRIVLTGFVANEDLAALYSGALAFIYPSFYEGFGLPPLEAMQCGVPVITSSTSSLPEVVADAGILVEPSDEASLCKAIFDIYTNSDLRGALSRKALLQSRNFSWQKTAELTLQAYRRALKVPHLGFSRCLKGKTIVVDAVFFQFRMTGIARVWFHLLEVWGQSEFGQQILVLDRAGTAPKIAGIRYREIPALNMMRLDLDRALLQAVCDEENAALFCSSYYTVPVTTPSVFMAYDMIPENTEFYDLENSMWQMKHHGIHHASAYLAISRSTALDLARFYPKARDKVTVAYCAVDRGRFYPATPSEVDNFKGHFNIHAPYVLFVGDRTEHKNGVLLFRTLAGMFPKGGLEVVCVGGAKTLEPAFEDLAKGFAVHVVQLGDRDLRAAYTGATALIYPSAYEGFGLPILEAMACDCPVITCSNSSIPEVAGGAAIYVSESNADEMAAAICNVMRPDVRQGLIQLGRSQVMRFSWERMADTVKHVLQQVPLL